MKIIYALFLIFVIVVSSGHGLSVSMKVFAIIMLALMVAVIRLLRIKPKNNEDPSDVRVPPKEGAREKNQKI